MMTQQLVLDGFLPSAGRPKLAHEAVRRAAESGQVSRAAGPRRIGLVFATPGPSRSSSRRSPPTA
jgi:hypothetical protein